LAAVSSGFQPGKSDVEAGFCGPGGKMPPNAAGKDEFVSKLETDFE
jgi:hypothetical protein